MRTWFLTLIALLSYVAAAQHPAHNPYLVQKNTKGEKLFFIPTDTGRATIIRTGYVVNESGQKILGHGLQYPYPLEPSPETELSGNFTLYGGEDTSEATSGFSYALYTFDQSGDFLYHPYFYDNGPDYRNQGTQRIVAKGKMGLVDRLGKIIIPARSYTYLDAARWGLIVACRNCRAYELETTGNSTRTGHEPAYTKESYDVYALDGKMLLQGVPYPSLPASWEAAQELIRSKGNVYKDDTTVQRLRRVLGALPEIGHYLEAIGPRTAQYRFVLYERPSAASPYYLFGLEAYRAKHQQALIHFLISPDGKEIFNVRNDLQLLMPYASWKTLPDEGKFKEQW
ncbi:hypothetical protein [Taibaiella koreensis]|uniref:hypothetical protein n=1 Tax=Taibaiella koreensis TaxID=1268548 RepID=UPI000E59DD82|nr:hypothetical protein [Taibaiella koreensis]